MAIKRAAKKSRAKKLSHGKKIKGVKTLTTIPLSDLSAMKHTDSSSPY